MKELSTEEKARRYDEALDRAKKLKENSDNTAVIDGCEQIFPELQGNEDEKMRQWIIDDIRYNVNNESLFYSEYKKKAEKAIAWLEKQGKTNSQNNNPFKIESDKFYFCIKDYFAGGCYRSKKGDIVLAKNGMNMMGLSPKEASEYFMPINPFKEHVVVDWFEKQREETVDNANKIRPKFDIGDWITCPAFIPAPHLLHVINNEDGLYELEDVYGTKKQSTISDIESIYDHWDFNDAKEGDVLSYETDEGDLWIMLYWSLYEPYEGHVHYHALLVNDKFTDKGTCCICIDDLKPATIEQHELLFRKMKEEGYQWDKNKKELVEQMTGEEHKQYMLGHQDETIYDMSFEEAQDYISKRGFDIPWNDGDVMVDERKLTQTVANV